MNELQGWKYKKAWFKPNNIENAIILWYYYLDEYL